MIKVIKDLNMVVYCPVGDALEKLGFDNVTDMGEDFEDNIKANYPDMYFADECMFDVEGSVLSIQCADPDVTEAIEEELIHFIDYRTTMVGEAIYFEEGIQIANIKQKVKEIEKTLAELKNLLA